MQYIDYDAIVKNAQFFKGLLGDTRMCAVVKCDAYSHGIERVAGVLCDIVDCFAVNDLSEAIKIEKYHKDVLILLPQSSANCKVAVQHGFILTIDSFETLQNLPSIEKSVRVHIKIDSGMSRLGFTIEQLPMLLNQIECKNIKVEGVFSHFYTENEKYCQEQLNYFEKCSKIVSRKFRNVTKHIANTGGVLLGSKYHLDMARVGLGLYGYGAPNLLTAKTVTAKVIAKKKIVKGSVVGYGATYCCDKDTDIAIIDIGYDKGYTRSLHQPTVKVGEYFTKVVGNICMSMSMVDVTNLPVQVGDEVVVLGQGVNPSTDDTVIYQLLCNLR